MEYPGGVLLGEELQVVKRPHKFITCSSHCSMRIYADEFDVWIGKNSFHIIASPPIMIETREFSYSTSYVQF